METEIINPDVENKNELLLTTEIQSYLLTTAKWAIFLAILGFIGAGLMVLSGLAMTVIGNSMTMLGASSGNPIFSDFIPFMGIFYILLAGIYFLPSLYLFQFADKTKKAIEDSNQEFLRIGLSKLKSTFKTLGMLTITFIILLIIGYSTIIVFTILSKF